MGFEKIVLGDIMKRKSENPITMTNEERRKKFGNIPIIATKKINSPLLDEFNEYKKGYSNQDKSKNDDIIISPETEKLVKNLENLLADGEIKIETKSNIIKKSNNKFTNKRKRSNKKSIKYERLIESLERQRIAGEKKRAKNLKSQKKVLNQLTRIQNASVKNKILDGFGKKFKNGYSHRDIDKLKKLLSLRGFRLTEKNLEQIDEIIALEHTKDFENKLSVNSPENFKDYVKNLLDAYGEQYKNHIMEFKILCQKKGYTFSKPRLEKVIKELKSQEELKLFEKQLLEPSSGLFTIQDVDKMNGSEFEIFLSILFEKMGYTVQQTPLSGDQGADLIIEKFNEKSVVQAKRYGKKVTNSAVQEVVAAIKHYNANNAFVVTNNKFTDSAIELANSNNVNLIDRSKLKGYINNHLVERIYLFK